MSERTIPFTESIRKILRADICKTIASENFFETIAKEVEQVKKNKFVGICPFCQKRRFVYNKKTGVYVCESCGKTGDLFDLAGMDQDTFEEGVDFVLQLTELIKKDRAKEKQRRKEEARLGGILCLPK